MKHELIHLVPHESGGDQIEHRRGVSVIDLCASRRQTCRLSQIHLKTHAYIVGRGSESSRGDNRDRFTEDLSDRGTHVHAQTTVSVGRIETSELLKVLRDSSRRSQHLGHGVAGAGTVSTVPAGSGFSLLRIGFHRSVQKLI